MGSYLLSLAWGATGKRAAERAWVKRSTILSPRHPRFRTSLGISMMQDQDIEAAHAAFDEALQYSPNFATARYNRAIIELEAMHFSRGWSDYEARFSHASTPGTWRDFPCSEWDGTSPVDGKLLVWAEQSVTTQILFLSVLPEINPPGGLIVDVASELVPLLRRSLPNAEIVGTTSPSSPRLFQDDIAAHIPMGRLCGYRRQSLAAFTNLKTNFLEADAERAIDLMLDVVKPEKRTIGIAWRPFGASDPKLTLDILEPVLRIPNVTWVSLENPNAHSEIEAFGARTGIHITKDHGVDGSNDMDGLATLTMACDLVLAVDKPIAHLAGALGRTVWTLLPNRHRARWYWFSQHHPRPQPIARWYSAMKLIWKRDEESSSHYLDRITTLVRDAVEAP
jgi:hypothetical protein